MNDHFSQFQGHLRWLSLMVVLSVSHQLYGGEVLADRVAAPHVTVTLLSETARIQPGVAFTVGLRLRS